MTSTGGPGSDATPQAPSVGFSRLLVLVTGSTSATGLPNWLDWVRVCYPDLALKVVLTRSAERFVTPAAMALHGGGEVFRDQWPDGDPTAWHVQWAEWADAMVVYPATLHFMARLALGLADTPALLAAQCTTAPIGVAPAVPPGGVQSPAFQSHWAALSARPNVVLSPPAPAVSLTTGRADGWGPAFLGDVLELVERCRVELAEAAQQGSDAASFLADGAHIDRA